MILFRRTRIKRAVKEYYEEGFFARLGNGIGPKPPLTIVYDTTGVSIVWRNRVRKIAYNAGWLRADEVIRVDSQKKFGTGFSRYELMREIPPSVYAEAMGA